MRRHFNFDCKEILSINYKNMYKFIELKTKILCQVTISKTLQYNDLLMIISC